MQKNNLWLAVSLFCNKQYWRDLMFKGIQPFLKTCAHNNLLKAYHLQFNYSGGENIRFPLLIAEDKTQETAMFIDSYFKSCFSQAPAMDNLMPVRGNRIFMDFPVNTIQYGLYTPDSTINLHSDVNFRMNFSALLMESFSDGGIDDTGILTLSLCLYLTLMNVTVQNSGLQFDDLMVMPFQFPDVNEKIIETEAFYKNFESNKKSLFELTHDIMNQSELLPYWLRKWHYLCELKFKQPGDGNEPILTGDAIYFEISHYINIHLGLSENMNFLLLSFIRKMTAVNDHEIYN
jgi:hypothetical protein